MDHKRSVLYMFFFNHLIINALRAPALQGESRETRDKLGACRALARSWWRIIQAKGYLTYWFSLPRSSNGLSTPWPAC